MPIMSNIQNNNSETGFTICPYCKKEVPLPFKIIRFYLSLYKIKNTPVINIHRAFTLNENNKDFINGFCYDTLKNKPFISNVILTRPYHNAFAEMAKLNLLDPKTIEDYVSKNVNQNIF
jgi:hypothetical protein